MAAIYWFCSDEQFQPEELIEHALAAEQAGFDGVMLSEHFHPWVADKGRAGFSLSILGAMAVTTKRIKLMTAVISPLFRFHPAVIAQAAATLDRLSGGRFELGVGSGENINEGPLGYLLPPYAERQATMREAISIISRLLNGEKLDYDGRYYQTKSAKLYSEPIHKIPLILAAGGPKSASWAGEAFDGVLISVKNLQEALTNVLKPARTLTTKADFKVVATHWSIFATSEAEAWQAIAPQRGLRAPDRDRAIDPEQLQTEADALPKSAILERYSIASSVDDYYNIYAPLISQLKADIVGIQTTSLNQISTIKILGEQLLPRLKRL